MTEERPTLVLMDGHSLAYRAFYALPDSLRTQTGQITNAVYGFTSMLIKMLGDIQPEAVAVCFDKGRDVIRTEAFPEYKAGRAETPDDFRSQLTLIDDVLEAMEIANIKVPGVEADDVIATIAERAKDAGFDVRIVTGDRDAMQLVDEHVHVLYTVRGISEVAEMDPASVEDKYGVRPDQYVDYAAMRGDTSDNLPGVPGVGEKTAAKFLVSYEDLDGIYANIDELPGKKVPAMMVEHRDQVFLNRKLMTLRRNVDVEVDLAQLQWGNLDPDNVRKVFGALEFRVLYDRLVEEVLGDVEEQEATGFDTTPQRVRAGELRDWIARAEGPVALVVGTTGPVPHTTWIRVGVASAELAPVAGTLDDLAREDLEALADLLADPERPKIVHDLKVIDHAVTSRGWELHGVRTDTMLAAYLLSPEQRSFDLERIALQFLQRTLTTLGDDGDEDQLSLDVEDPWEQRALRAQATFELGEELHRQLEERGQTDLLHDIEQPLAPAIARMERNGIAIDLSVLAELRDRLSQRSSELQDEIWHHAGREFNVGSGPQLQEVLFEELELPKTRRIKTGWSTDATELGKLLGEHPIVEAVLEWREVSKLLSTYIDALPPLVDHETGRIHSTFSQTVAATGRLSSSDPNLQNIPVRREEGREIRRAFVPGDGYDQLLVCDYSQIELRVMAHMCEDEGLLDAFRSGEDIHATTAAKVFDMDLEYVDGPLRDRAKAINYGLAYGLTAYGLGQQIGIPPDEAQEIVDAYMARFPKVREFLDHAVLEARRDGYTTTLFGRRRYLPDLLSDNRRRREMAERMALNAPIQGTAADIIKLAMVQVQEALDRSDLGAQMLLQVHDELVFEVADDELEATTELVVEAMAGVAELAVPLDVDTAHGPTWYGAQKH